MTALGAVILAHRDPAHVRRLVRALGDVPVVLHCDSKASTEVAAEMLQGAGPNVAALPRTSGALNSWSLVRIELDALRAALTQSAASHIAVLSGSDYPLVGPEELDRLLGAWTDRSYLLSRPIPFAPWSTPRHPDGGRWRTAHRFLTRGDDLISVRGVPLRLPWRRALPEGLQLRASSQWKVYARRDVESLLRVVDSRPDLLRFWRSTLVPDESFASSILSSPAITGEPSLPLCYDAPWYTHWPHKGAHHPTWLDVTHFDELVANSRAIPGTPAELERPQSAHPRAWFGRKFSTSVSSELLDRIDAELR